MLPRVLLYERDPSLAKILGTKASELDVGPGISVIEKPYDLDELIEAVLASNSIVRRN